MAGGGSILTSKVEFSNITGSGVERRQAVGGAEPPQTHQKNLMFFAMFVFFILEISPRKDEDISGGGRAAAQFNEILHRGWASFKHKDGL